MPSPTAQTTLSVAGQTLQLNVGQTGVGQPPDVTAVFGFTGIFANAVIGIEAVPLGQPINQPSVAGPFGPVSPVSLSEWIPIGEQGVLNGQNTSSPLTLSSLGGLGTGFAYVVPVAPYQMLQIRLISIGSGAVVASIATGTFPASTGLSANPSAALTQLELGRIRIGMSILIGGGADPGGFNLQDPTAADVAGFT